MTEFLCPYKGCGETKKSRIGIKKHLESCFYQKHGPAEELHAESSQHNISCYKCHETLYFYILYFLYHEPHFCIQIFALNQLMFDIFLG